VWCCISKLGIVGPYFFEEEGIAVTVTSARYVEMLNNFLRSELERRQVNIRDIWFQQNGATAHTARASMAVVRQMFPGHVISRFGDVHWPPRSSDLSICDFFLWGYLKSKVYINKPRTLEDLKNSIRQEIEAVPNEMLERAIRNFQKRIHICIQQERRHLKDIIFQT